MVKSVFWLPFIRCLYFTITFVNFCQEIKSLLSITDMRPQPDWRRRIGRDVQVNLTKRRPSTKGKYESGLCIWMKSLRIDKWTVNRRSQKWFIRNLGNPQNILNKRLSIFASWNKAVSNWFGPKFLLRLPLSVILQVRMKGSDPPSCSVV